MSSLFFSKPDPTEATTRTACSKLSNNAALVVNELAREPAQGLLHVATHVQRSIPALLKTNQHLEAAAAQLQCVLSELQDAQEGVLSITSPVTQQDLEALAGSIHAAANTLQQQQQREAGSGAGGAAGGGAAGAAGGGRLRKLFAASGSTAAG